MISSIEGNGMDMLIWAFTDRDGHKEADNMEKFNGQNDSWTIATGFEF